MIYDYWFDFDSYLRKKEASKVEMECISGRVIQARQELRGNKAVICVGVFSSEVTFAQENLAQIRLFKVLNLAFKSHVEFSLVFNLHVLAAAVLIKASLGEIFFVSTG